MYFQEENNFGLRQLKIILFQPSQVALSQTHVVLHHKFKQWAKLILSY